MVDLKAKPFSLSDQDIDWVKSTLNDLSFDEKIAQLFCLVAYAPDEGMILNMAKNVKPGGVMCRAMTTEEVCKTVGLLQSNSKIPMLISANLERGGNGITTEGTTLGSPMQVAATGDAAMANKLGQVCAKEGVAVGANWAFAPIVDIDYNFRNPITNVRTFGSDVDTVKSFGVEYIKAVQENGVAASTKHFPGDGVDERDQHLVTTVNTMTCDEWDNSFKKVYDGCIDAGSLSIMAGHICLPSWTKKINPDIADEDILPASLSPEMITGLLRDRLGFNGLVVTDATAMCGMAIPMPRHKAVPQAIAAGCDMFLFTRNMEEDFGFMKQGVQDGIISEDRLNDAVTRILATKAAIRLHEKHAANETTPILDDAKKEIALPEYTAWAEECADKAITLVKNKENVLPISVAKHKRILLVDLQTGEGFFHSTKTPVYEVFSEKLKAEGFEVERFDASKGMEGLMQPSTVVSSKYDLILYLANLDTKSNQTTVRIEWAEPMGANVPIHITSVPTVFISLENPYHLLDVPRVKTYINTYGTSDIVLDALLEKLLGHSEFKGKSPIDPFCGKWDAKL